MLPAGTRYRVDAMPVSRPYSLARPRTSPSQGGVTGSNPVGATATSFQFWHDILSFLAPLAQLVELLTFNLQVGGSSPSRCTISSEITGTWHSWFSASP